MVDTAYPQVEEALSMLTADYADVVEEIVTDMQPCEHCRTQKYETYVLLTVPRYAFVRAHQTGEQLQ